MFSVQLYNFKVPSNLISVFKSDNLNDPRMKQTIQGHHFNSKVIIHYPHAQPMEKQVTENLIEDQNFYTIKNLNLAELCKIEFIEGFLNNGAFQAYSCGRKLDLDNSAAFSPTGILSIVLDKFSYYKVGIHGKLTKHILSTPKEKFVIQIDTKQKGFHPGKALYERIQKNLNNFPLLFNFRITWTPNNNTICRSCIAKYFSDLGYQVCEERCVYHKNSFEDITIPTLTDIKLSDAENILNWLGLCALQIESNEALLELCPNEYSIIPHSNIYVLQVDGFYSADIIQILVEKLRKRLIVNDEVPWICVTVYGDPDCCIAWQNEENCFRLNGDNHYTLIIHKNNVTCIKLEASQKPDRFYDKSSNT